MAKRKSQSKVVKPVKAWAVLDENGHINPTWIHGSFMSARVTGERNYLNIIPVLITPVTPTPRSTTHAR